MRQIFDMFPRAYVINVATRPDRRAETIAELARQGIAAPSDSVRFHSPQPPDAAAGFPSAGVRGCFESHLAVLEMAEADGLPSVLVCEDDIRFASVSADDVSRVVQKAQAAPWDVLYFGYLFPPNIFGHAHVSHTLEWTQGGHFYAVRQPFLSAMAAFMRACLSRPPGDPEGGPMYRDGAYNHVRRHRAVSVWLASPILAEQRASRSNLAPLKWFDRAPGVRAVADRIRRAPLA